MVVLFIGHNHLYLIDHLIHVFLLKKLIFKASQDDKNQAKLL